MLNCHGATAKLSKQKETALTKSERWSLLLHKAMCSKCRRFGQQIDQLSDLARAFSPSEEPSKAQPPHAEKKQNKLP